MTKRVLSGIFILVALGALGMILASALSSGEQLIVRFLTAVIVAALALYVVSDLRMQADESRRGRKKASGRSSSGRVVRPTGDARGGPAPGSPAFMATVTGRRPVIDPDRPPTMLDDDLAGRARAAEPAPTGALPTIDRSAFTSTPAPDHPGGDLAAPLGEPADDDRWPDFSLPPTAATAPTRPGSILGGTTAPSYLEDEDVASWPRRPSIPTREDPVVGPAPLGAGPGPDDGPVVPERHAGEQLAGPDLDPAADLDDDGDIDELVALFARKTERELEALEARGQLDPLLFGAGATGADAVNGAATTGEEPVTRAATVADGELTASTVVDGHQIALDPEDSTDERLADVEPGDDRTIGAEEPSEEPGVDGPERDRTAGPEPHLTLAVSRTGDTDEVPVTGPAAPAPVTASPPAARYHRTGLDAAAYASAPIAPIIDLRSARDSGDDIETAIRSGELEVISSLIEQGVLTSEGPISDRDVRTMVYVAFTSNELRKILLAGGVIDGDNSSLDLGRVEVFQPAVTPSPVAVLGTGPLEADSGMDEYEAPRSQAL